MDGTSFAYTLDDPDAAERHTVQYFEMYGSRAIYKDGWWACAKLDKLPWDFSPATLAAVRARAAATTPTRTRGSSTTCRTTSRQAHDLAAEHPEKLAELKELFWQEAERNRVLPLLGGFAVFFGILPPMPTITRFTFAGDVQNISDDDDPAHLRPVVRDRGRRARARGRRRGRARAPSPTSSAGSRCGWTRRAS